MDVPYCFVRGKAALGKLVHLKNATALALTEVRKEVLSLSYVLGRNRIEQPYHRLQKQLQQQQGTQKSHRWVQERYQKPDQVRQSPSCQGKGSHKKAQRMMTRSDNLI